MRILFKIGSNLLQTEEGDIDFSFLSNLARAIKVLKSQGDQVLIVSSGAVLCGIKKLNLKEKPKDITQKQVLAGVGQAYLMHIYDSIFSNYGLVPAQVLLTSDVFREAFKFQTAKSTMERMLSMGIVPVINENDAVAVSELIFGDNDFLAIHSAFMMDVELVVFLSTAGGLRDPEGKVVPSVKDVDEAFQLVKKESSLFGTGGMYSKLLASKIASSMGINVIITGKDDQLVELRNLKTNGTLIEAKERKLKQKKKTIAMMEETKGAIYIDDGACKALKSGKSLLPAGVTKVEGYFGRGDTVSILSQDGFLIGKGKVNFSSEEIKKVLGKRGEEVKSLLKTSKEEVIHRDYLVVF